MKRLETIFSLIPKVNVFADIGCDHGKLLKMAVDAHLAELIIGADISEPSLLKAKELLKKAENVEFYVSDGFQNIPRSVDAAVISGMGGKEIIHILKKSNVSILILQPQKNADCVREFLINNGFVITADVVVFESGKFYDVIKAEKSDIKTELTSEQLKYGVFYKEKNETRKARLLYLKKKCESYFQTQEVLDKLKSIEEALLWQQ